MKSLAAAKAALEKKASDLIVYDVRGLTTIADYFIICSGDSLRQVRAIRDHVEEILSKKGCHPYSTEGENTGRWVLMDYSDLVVHVFKNEVRGFYALERLWGDAPQLEVEEGKAPIRPLPAKKIAAGGSVRRKRGGVEGL